MFLKGDRSRRYKSLPGNIMVQDLTKGIPFGNDSVDAVYHSHLLEHLDRGKVALFLQEVRRVLKPGGVNRIVVPDLEKICRSYLAHLEECDDPIEANRHDEHVAAIIEQCVRREPAGASRQPWPLKYLENMLIGDALKRGEAHRWMYDRVNLSVLLGKAGFSDVKVVSWNLSRMPWWNDIGLDADNSGGHHEYSLFMEAVK